MSALRVSETEQIQQAFREAVKRLWEEVVVDVPLPPSLFLPGTIDGEGMLKSLSEMQNSLETLGFRPEHISVLKSLCTALKDSARVQATPVNVGLFGHLFNPTTPTTPLSAEAYKEAVAIFTRNIGPKKKGWAKWFS